MKLKKPKRADFEKGHYGKQDFEEALMVYYLVDKALEYGAPIEELAKVLRENDGGFNQWEFLFSK